VTALYLLDECDGGVDYFLDEIEDSCHDAMQPLLSLRLVNAKPGLEPLGYRRNILLIDVVLIDSSRQSDVIVITPLLEP
jgi:hypothetical protein